MTRLATLRSTVAELEWTWSALGVVERDGGGNPNHDEAGKFASSPGGAGHGKHHARRQRRKARLAKLHRRYKRDVAALKARHKGERKELVKDQRAEHRDLRHEHRKERKALPGELKRERASLVKDQRAEKQGLGHEQRKEAKHLERQHAKELARHDASPSPDPEHRRAIEAEHAEERAAMSDVHQADRENMVESHRDARREMIAEHKAARGDLRLQQADERASQRQGHQEDRKSTRATHAEERQELMGQIREELSDHGFKRKRRDATRGAGPDLGYDDQRSTQEVGRRFHPGRTHKAGSAESILRACLRRRGWSAAWRRGELSAGQSLELLQDIREYGRAWLHHEADALFKAHGVEQERALGGAARSHVGRFFARARQFVRELIVAGAMALSGPEALTGDELREADHAAQVQAEYLDRFHGEVVANPPVELQPPAEGPPLFPGGPPLPPLEPSGKALKEPMTAAEFAARAEQYGGNAGWSDPLNIDRKTVIRSGKAVREARFHWRPTGVDHPCATCKAESQKGFVPIGTLNPIGDSECLGISCDCYFVYELVDGSRFITSRGWK